MTYARGLLFAASAMVLAVLLVPLSAAGAAELVIVESTAPQLPAGQVINTTSPLVVPAGARIAIVGDDGKVNRIEGPYSGTPTAAAPAAGGAAAGGDKGVVPALSRLFADKGPSASSWGTFRGAEGGDGADTPPEVWAINMMHAETVCVPSGVEPFLWRADASQAASLILLQLATGREGAIEIIPGKQTAPWPPTLQLRDGGEYAIRDTGNTWERRLFIRVIPADKSSGIAQVAWMSDAGCVRQAKRLLTQLTN
ncbi:hypothetical protein [Defluviicoccus vanus]|uniref:Uncharacterized protein n=1 Tax=Defluviicoccus vanus TaxID=111831 RepID=A0A7H1MZJ6_9PROT|nr:hypothetical protein [Defluviicoccus vanus]QNT68882.1 hypothetical protein HQ394_05325 [Defluviicoccus vanus]